MARHRISKDLPPLEQAFAEYTNFPANSSRQTLLTDYLRNCAKELQTDKPRPFYSMREVATFFSVPLRTTALAYESLDLEGLLHRIRGSQTMLVGRKPITQKPINAIVGLPIWLQAMITSPFECNLQMELEERLRVRGYVADSIFYRSREDFEPSFTDRLLRHNLDLLIWQSPHPLASHVLMSLRERGVRLILIQSKESALNLPARTHYLDWQPAYQKMITHWKENDIQSVVIPEPENLLARRALRRIKPMLVDNGFDFKLIEPEPEALETHFAAASTPKSALAFIDFVNADNLCNGSPGIIQRIAEKHRLAFCRGPVRVPRFTTQKIGVDLIELDPIELAENVITDLCDPNQLHEGVRGSIEAKFYPDEVMHGLNEHERVQLSI